MTNYYDTEMRLQLARAGILGPMFLLAENVPPGQKPREFDAEKQLGVTDFQLGENQTIGEQQALTIHHKLHNRNYTEPLAVSRHRHRIGLSPPQPLPRATQNQRLTK